MTAKRGSPERSEGEAGRQLPCILEDRLRKLGLWDVVEVVTHTNRTVMLSITSRRVLRIHRGYAFAPDRVLKAIVRFLNPRVPRTLRRIAEREFLAFPVEEHAPPARSGRQERARPGDLLLLHRLESLHRELNVRYFDGKLQEIRIRLSERMRTRLGELSVDLRTGRPLEMSLSRRHLARHTWAEVEHTLLHEMVHQWQAEMDLPIDHGPAFRRKAREVGVLPRAKRVVSRTADWVAEA